MQREIRFRAWDIIQKEFVSPQVVAIDGAGFLLRYDEGWHEKGTERYKISQFTGLRDVEGKEIYRGDILRAMMGNGFGSIGEDVAEVAWNEKSAQFVMKNDNWGSDNESNIPINCYVVGNIYESPDLLTV
jgi:uncharacterized phage protein (TIGR01671 family)